MPQPIARWDFAVGAEDTRGAADAELRGSAKLESGGLTVRQGGHAVTKPLEVTLRAKTLEAWVRLDNLDQRGGGVLTIQTRDGSKFDSIVFGEQAPRQWLAGSDFFSRTQTFSGAAETEADRQPVHLAIAYHADGRVAGYRNGKPYGTAYQSNGPQEFAAGESVVSFGLRHLPAGGNRLLSGSIVKAHVYDRALSAEEVAASANGGLPTVSAEQVLAELTPTQRGEVAQHRSAIEALEAEAAAWGPVRPADDLTVWTDLAQSLFLFKEFLYVR